MARKSKSSESKDNSNSSSEIETPETEDAQPQTTAESSADAPVVIEGEAVEVSDADETGTSVIEESAPEDVAASADAIDGSEPEPVETAPVQPASGKGVSSALPLVLGGVVAGVIGFFGANLARTDAPQFDPSPLTAEISANAERLTTLGEDIAGLKAADLPGLGQQLSALSDQLATLTEGVAAVQADVTDTQTALTEQAQALDVRILALETAVPAASGLEAGEELAALRERITEMTSAAEEQLAIAQTEAASIARAAEEARMAAEAEAEELRAAAEAREAELQALAQRQEALIDLKAAVETGAPFGELIAGLGDVPEVLRANAEGGVPTLQVLQQGFPDAARTALAQTNTVAEDASAGERFTSFLKRRANVRSLTPKEGDGPDAVLSRAEAALGQGDVPTTVSELENLPEEGKAALAAWLDQAKTRQSAIAAVDQLSATN